MYDTSRGGLWAKKFYKPETTRWEFHSPSHHSPPTFSHRKHSWAEEWDLTQINKYKQNSQFTDNSQHTCYEKVKGIMFIENCIKIIFFSCSIMIREVCILDSLSCSEAARLSYFLYLITIYIAGTEKREKMSIRWKVIIILYLWF